MAPTLPTSCGSLPPEGAAAPAARQSRFRGPGLDETDAALATTPTVAISAPSGGMVDVYRQLHPDTTGDAYTWWSNRGQAYANNVGWRLDYHLATPAMAARARTAAIHKEPRFSDHAPLTVDYDFQM